jgi:hypothetical protein
MLEYDVTATIWMTRSIARRQRVPSTANGMNTPRRRAFRCIELTYLVTQYAVRCKRHQACSSLLESRLIMRVYDLGEHRVNLKPYPCSRAGGVLPLSVDLLEHCSLDVRSVRA